MSSKILYKSETDFKTLKKSLYNIFKLDILIENHDDFRYLKFIFYSVN